MEDCHILSGKIRETVYVKHMILPEGSHLQMLQQPGHLIPWIPFSLSTQGVVAFHQKGQLLQLLRQIALRLFCRKRKICRGNAAAFEFIHRINQPGEKLRLCLDGGIRFQAAAELPGCGCHGHQTAAVIQAFLCGAPQIIRHPPGKTGKGQNLRIAAGGVSGSRCQPPFRFVADKLRNHQNPSRPPLPDIPGYSVQNLLSVGRPVPTQ